MRTILLVAVAAGALALAGCGGDADTATPETTATETAGETAPSSTETTTETSSPEPKPAKPKPKPRMIVIVVDQGRPRGGIKRPKLEKGEKVVIVVRADAGEELHVHGYDIEKPVTPGKPVRVPLTASIPGRFEVELHHPDSLLAVLEVRP
jgi:hypothetical protein